VSKQSKLRLLVKTRDIIQNNKSASAGALITLLNPIIVGWCNYYRYAECVKDFKQVEYALFGQLRAWVFRRRSKGLRSRTSIKEKYFPSNTTVKFRGTNHSGSWIFVGSVLGRKAQKKEVFLVYPGWIKSEMWVKIEGQTSPFMGHHMYWARRKATYSALNQQKVTLLTRQKFKRPLCGSLFKERDIVEIDHMKPLALGGKQSYDNLQAVHDYCHHIKSTQDMKNIRLEKRKGNMKRKMRPCKKETPTRKTL
jgi:RNA-directed DNA polymerase